MLKHKKQSLTSEEQVLHDKWYDECLRIGISTESADRILTEKIISKMYKKIGEQIPEFRWFDSPKAVYQEMPSLIPSLGAALEPSLRASLRASLESSLRASLEPSLGSSLWYSLGAALEPSLRLSLASSLWSSLRTHLGSSLWHSLRLSLGSPIESYYFIGQFEMYWIGYYRFCEMIGVKYKPEDSEILGWWEALGRICNWLFPYENICMCCEKPVVCEIEIRGDDKISGIQFRDGWTVMAVNGKPVKMEEILD